MKRTKAAAAPVELRIEYMALQALRKFPGNPKAHAGEVIAGSIETYGFNDPLAIDEKSGHLSEGHGRLEQLEAMRAAGKPLPQHIVEAPDGSDWLVPVVRGCSFKSRAELERYIVVHNQGTIAGGFGDGVALAGILQRSQAAGVSMASMGFDGAAMARLAVSSAAGAKTLDPIAIDTSPVHDEFWITVRGPLPAQREALDLLRKHLGKLEGVAVDMGTIER